MKNTGNINYSAVSIDGTDAAFGTITQGDRVQHGGGSLPRFQTLNRVVKYILSSRAKQGLCDIGEKFRVEYSGVDALGRQRRAVLAARR